MEGDLASAQCLDVTRATRRAKSRSILVTACLLRAALCRRSAEGPNAIRAADIVIMGAATGDVLSHDSLVLVERESPTLCTTEDVILGRQSGLALVFIQ